MTRGALTTFSIANDVAKYFAIIPALFVAFYPQLGVLNVMQLATPQSAILSAIIFNALIIIALIPLALKGVAYRPIGAGPLLQRNLLIYGLGGIVLPFIGHQGHRPRGQCPASGLRKHRYAERTPPRHRRAGPAGRPSPGLVYPLAMTGIAGVIFPKQAQGSLIEKDGKVIGSALIGQAFVSDKYFHGRPSATNAPDPKDATKTVDAPYNAANSMGSNLGPTSKALADRIKGDVDTLKKENPAAAIPVDLVTTSGSGLDPDISPAAALFQVPRVAKARGLPEPRLRALVEAQTEGRTLGLLGEPRVNVLKLNLALDALKS